MRIHPKAIIENGAVLGNGVTVEAYALIGQNAVLKDKVYVPSFARVTGKTIVGENTFIGHGAVVGEMPQMLGLKSNEGNLSIGKNNIIREYVTIHSSTSREKSTIIGNNNYIMGLAHIGHDCIIGNDNVVCNAVLIAGHVLIQDNVFISGNSVIHQFARIGRMAMIGGLSRVNQDVPPFMMVVGNSRVWGLNIVGLKRAGFKNEEIRSAKKAFRSIYRSKSPPAQAIKDLRREHDATIKEIVEFIDGSKRGICGGKQNSFLKEIFLDYPYLLLFLRKKSPVRKYPNYSISGT